MKPSNVEGVGNQARAALMGYTEPSATRAFSWVEDMQNNTGADIVEGSVVVVVADGTVQRASTLNDPRPTGVTLDYIENGETGQVAFGGPVELVLVTASVTAGQYGQTSTTAGQAQVTTGPASAFCMFTSSGTSPEAFLWGGRGGGGVGGGGTVVPFWFNVRDYGATGDGVTDDTVAIQATIDAANTAGGGVIYFPAGIYIIGGALQDTGARNAQLLLPTISTSAKQISLVFLGALRPTFALHGPVPTSGGLSILKSTLTGASGTAAVISGGSGTWPTQNNVEVSVEDLTCLAPDNPTLTWWNVQTCQGGSWRNVMVNTPSTYAGTYVQPTNSNAYGVKLPQWGQTNYTYVDGLMVSGFYTGLKHGELATCRGLIFGPDVIALEIPTSEHASLIVSMHQTGCGTGIKVTGSHYVDILQYDAEHLYSPTFPSWMQTTYDLDDGSNYMKGHVRWFGLDGTGQVADHKFAINGGSGVLSEEIGQPSAGAVGEILISDTPSTPLVFADLLQNEAQDDLLYADL